MGRTLLLGRCLRTVCGSSEAAAALELFQREERSRGTRSPKSATRARSPDLRRGSRDLRGEPRPPESGSPDSEPFDDVREDGVPLSVHAASGTHAVSDGGATAHPAVRHAAQFANGATDALAAGSP